MEEDELEIFNKIKIGIASDEKIREWSKGEVKKPETINYRTLKPEKDGLFCEKIFGPTKDWECHCGKYKRVRYKGIVCDKCGVEVTKSKVRRERMGHIELAAPVAHIWYFKGIPSRIALMLDISPRNLEKVIYFASYIVTDKGTSGLEKCQILTEKEYHEAEEKYGRKSFKAEMGAEAIRKLLEEIDLAKLTAQIEKEIENASEQRKAKLIKRLDTVEAFLQSGNRPEWMVMNVVPVIPPDLRPMVQLDGGRFATSDLNDLYRRVINRNNRLKRLLELGAPEIIVRNEKRMLQESVDALIDNSRRGRPVTGAGNRPLKSLSDLLKGKQGRFRQNLLGKRVDYSGRSVIVVGPELKIYQCGLPKEMAIELFKPFVMKELVERHLAHNIKSAKRMVERLSPEVWGILEEVIKDHPVMLNRAPTLHRLGIQSFEPVLVEGRAIKLHALVCEAFNADFDGDQMAIHLPLTPEAQAESRYLMLATNNLLKPQDGKPVAVPRLDMILGSYYLTMTLDGELGEGKYFKDPDEAIMALQNNAVSIHAKIFVRITKEIDGEMKSKKVETSVGRIIFNQGIPQDLGFIDRKEDPFQYEINFPVMKKSMGTIIERTIDKHGLIESAEVIDYIKALGFKYSTLAGITFSVADVKVPDSKKDILADADKQVEKVRNQYRRGLITDDERYQSVVNIWEKATNDVSKAMEENFDDLNPIYMMVKSGARGNMNQLRQIAGMRGLMASTTGKAVEIPIKSCFREGLDALEYFISSHGARKGLSDTALRTADSGYLTRRLVDVSQDIIVREHDCGTVDGLTIEDIKDGNQIVEGLAERLEGRYPLNDILDPQTNEVIVDTNTMINKDIAKRIVDAGITKVVVRSVIACRGKHGVCQKCYGMGLARRDLVSIGESVGIIAAQSIGEPGTQLTMRTIHSGGVAGVADITQGLPRVEEIFEARKPKGVAVITEIDGTVKISDNKKKLEVIVTSKDDSRTYTIPFGSKLKVKDGDEVKAADPLIEGSINPAEILAIKGPEGVYEYVISEIQKAYRNQGVDINDKHVEVIARQMLRKVRVDDGGDTDMFPGSLVDMYEFEDKNKEAVEQGKRPATGKRALLGITKASLATDSFLSAASFQETTRVLTEAAIKGKEDDLIGLKENVIIGKLIPAGTGMKRYQDVTIKVEGEDEKTVAEEIDANKQVEIQSDAE
ncbi:MAG: DNA-directed RNA polymerase subunit beta' [Clostridia bacterium]|jgi:DNA-directed RNA polymerase subunit beta'|nr:DNA-directed RNA polymerase subunit beta' [Clostridium sp.]MEE1380368.1 DNA-directed RNA polymerase subunit beta' [Clostridia bacterium]CDE55978.1 dNA-directed RNA polymerase [Clostridium sp. CAG:269]